MLQNFAAKTYKFKAELVGGKTVELFLRPYTLADLSWSQAEFPKAEDMAAVADLKVEPLCKIIWRSLSPESRDIFFRIKFEAEQDPNSGAFVEVQPEGWQRLMHGLKDVSGLLAGWEAMARNMTDNGFMPEEKGSKKKPTAAGLRIRTSGPKFMTWWRRRTA